MKKWLYAFLAILIVFAMVSCETSTTPTKKIYTVTFDGNGNTGGTVPAAMKAEKGASITLPGNTGSLVKSGHIFGGWSTSASGTSPLTAGATVL